MRSAVRLAVPTLLLTGPAATTLAFQAWIADSAWPQGDAASLGLRATKP